MSTPPPDPQPDRDDTDAGYRDTLEEEAYEEARSGRPREPREPEEPREPKEERDGGG